MTLTELSKEDTHVLLKTFFKEKGLVRQHLDSYNEFIDHGLQEVVDEVAEIPIDVPESPYKVKFGQIWVIDPQSRITGSYAAEVDGSKHEIYPMEARLRNLAYAAPVALEMTPVINGSEQEHRACLHWKHTCDAKIKTLFSLSTITRSARATTWFPLLASEQMTLTWDQEGKILVPNEVIQAVLVLAVSSSIDSSISDFNFDVAIQCDGV